MADREAVLAAITTATALTAAFPALCAEIRNEATLAGATAERERILGIQAHAMAGHEALVASMVADPAVTPDMAAGRILGAERELRAGQLQAVVDVENHTGRVVAAPAASAAAIQPAAAAAATTPEGWASEFAAATPAGEKLRSEFASKEDYVAFKANESKVRILRK